VFKVEIARGIALRKNQCIAFLKEQKWEGFWWKRVKDAAKSSKHFASNPSNNA